MYICLGIKIMASLEQEIHQERFVNDRIKATLNVLYTANWLNNMINASLKPFNLTHEQYNVLRILRGKHPQCMCQKDILRRMIARNSNITLIIKKLVTKSMVQVLPSAKDGREYEISITPKGLELLTLIDKDLESKKDTMSTLSESEAFHLNALLDKIRS